MKLIKCALLLALLACFACCFNEVNAENYFCSTENFKGDFDPDNKGGAESCDYLKDFSLPYSVCLQNATFTEEAYELGLEAYNNGKCVPYQTRNMKVGTATCTAKFIAEKDFASLSINTGFGKTEDRQACYEKLEKALKTEFPDLNQLSN